MHNLPRVLVALLLAISLSGCIGGDKADSDGNGTAPPDGQGSEPVNDVFAVQILSAPTSQDINEPVSVTWSVSSGPHPGHSMYNAIRWSQTSFANETNLTLETYEKVQGLVEHQNIPADEGLEFTTEFEFLQTGMYYMRAVGRNGSTHHFSEEVAIEITGVKFTNIIHEVLIGNALGGSPPANLATFDPDPVEARIGDGVKWTNMDPSTLAHSAIASEGAPTMFGTAELAQGETSDVIRFLAPGTYEYKCGVHPETMSGSIVVTE